MADVVKTLADSINTNVLSAFGKIINTDDDENNAMGGSLAFTVSTLTISAGSVTAKRAHHIIAAQTGATVGAASIGFLIGDVGGAAVGAIIGATGPEILTLLLMSKPAMAFLNAAAKAGRGKVSRRSWQIAAQILVSQMRQKTETPFSAIPRPEQRPPPVNEGPGASLTLP